MKSSPSFQWYPGDWFGSQRVQMLTLEEEGAYIRLLGSCWQHGSIPSDLDRLARLIGKGASSNLARVVASMFTVDANDPERLVHDRLDDERRKQDAWRAKCAIGGKNSAKTRQNGKGSSTTATRVVNVYREDSSGENPTLLSSSSPLGEEKKGKDRPKDAEEAEEYAVSIGCSPGQGDAFFDKMEGCGWVNGGKPVKNWRATIRSWHKQNYMPNAVNYKAPERQQQEFTYVPEDRTQHPMWKFVHDRMNGIEPEVSDEIIYIEQERD